MKHAPELKKALLLLLLFVAAYCAGTGVGFLISPFREAPAGRRLPKPPGTGD